MASLASIEASEQKLTLYQLSYTRERKPHCWQHQRLWMLLAPRHVCHRNHPTGGGLCLPIQANQGASLRRFS